jgi:hypothetical protein
MGIMQELKLLVAFAAELWGSKTMMLGFCDYSDIMQMT